MSHSSPVRHVSDTALWVACYRAMESERPDALFRDPWARTLAGDRGQAIVDRLPRGRATAWPMVTRTVILDEMILRLIDRGIDTVLNLAAGLDTRPWRLGLPPSLRWIEVDLPDLLAYKQERMAGTGAVPVCRLEQLSVDLGDPAARGELLAGVARDGNQVLVITEGLLVYLDPDAVDSIARDLAHCPPIRYWLTDLGSPALLRMMSKSWGPALQAGNAPFRFGPAESTGFFRQAGWVEQEWRSLFHESIEIDRTMRFARFWRWLGRLRSPAKQEEFRRFSGIALLGRPEESPDD